MQLLVSVRNREEAIAAVAGGAAIVDAKEPSAGALGRVPMATFREIVDGVGGQRPVSAALGEADDFEDAIAQRARSYAAAGARFVKLGFAGLTGADDVERLTAAAIRGAVPVRAAVIGVAYVDHDMAGSLPPGAIVDALARVHAQGVLLDTFRKEGEGVRGRMTDGQIRDWVTQARAAGLMAGVAGQLTLEDLAIVAQAGADIAGVRSAACEHGREGRVSAARVRALSDSLTRGAPAAFP